MATVPLSRYPDFSDLKKSHPLMTPLAPSAVPNAPPSWSPVKQEEQQHHFDLTPLPPPYSSIPMHPFSQSDFFPKTEDTYMAGGDYDSQQYAPAPNWSEHQPSQPYAVDLARALESFSLSSHPPTVPSTEFVASPSKIILPPPIPPPLLEPPRPARAMFVAHNTASMLCYLWFSREIGTPRPGHHSSPFRSYPTPARSPKKTVALPRSSDSFSPKDPETARLQFTPNPVFVEFLHELLSTTQVSQSVIVLSLHYVYRLRVQNPDIRATEGSEFRLAVVALMLANKFLDDNTYTNKTWGDVSHISLAEINVMETEFLLGVDNRLYVDLPTYESWLNLLDGLLEAKERDVQSWMRRADFVSGPRALRVSPLSKHRSRQRLHHPQSQPQLYQRARSSSPLASFRAAPSYAFTFAPPIPLPNPFTATTQSRPSTGNARPTQPLLRPPPLHPQYVQSQPPPQPPPAQSSGSKRTIRDAFSPQTIAQSIHLNPPKRPISLDMSSFHLSESSRSGFQQPSRAFATPPRQNSYAMDLLTPPDSVPQRTLAAPFIPDQTRAKSSFPQYLVYHALASTQQEGGARKSILRYHNGAPMATAAPITQSQPQAVQLPSLHQLQQMQRRLYNPQSHSANASPMDMRYLPPPVPTQPFLNQHQQPTPPQHPQQQQQQQQQQQKQQQLGGRTAQFAPFANAGPPGVQWTTTTYDMNNNNGYGSQHLLPPAMAMNWSPSPRGRRMR